METILKAIQDRIGENVTDLKHIDENWGQLDLFGNEIPVQWPCCLIMLNTANFSNLGNDVTAVPMNRQEGLITVELTIAKLKLTNTSFKAPLLQKEKAWEIWGIVRKTHEIIHGWSPEVGSGKMIRTGLSTVRRDDGVQEIRIIYSIGLHNC